MRCVLNAIWYSFRGILPFAAFFLVCYLAILWPRAMAVVMTLWVLFVTISLIRGAILNKGPAGSVAHLWLIFNVPTLVVGLIVWWSW